MTMLTVHEGIYRAARRTGRGRRKRRGEFVSLDSASSLSLSPLLPRLPVAAPEVVLSPGIAEMRISEERNASGEVALRISGALDLATLLPFRDAVFTAIGRRPIALLLDLEDIGAVDLAGVSTLITIARVARLLQVPLYLAPSASLRETLETTGICRMLALRSREAVQ